jgi:hypothetical protein
MSSRRGHLARVALCPTGCKNTAGKLMDIGHGGCDQCVHFNKQGVAEQGVISARLIEAENEVLREAAAIAIPMPTSPNKEANAVVRAGQSFHASLLYEQKQASRLGAAGECGDELTAEERKTKEAAELKSATKNAEKDRRERETKSKEAHRNESMFDLDPDTESALKEVSIIGIEVEIRESIGKGRGAFAKVFAKKGKHLARYDGNRVDGATGETKMFCSRMKHLLTKVSPAKKLQIQQLRYSKTWALTNRKGVVWYVMLWLCHVSRSRCMKLRRSVQNSCTIVPCLAEVSG